MLHSWPKWFHLLPLFPPWTRVGSVLSAARFSAPSGSAAPSRPARPREAVLLLKLGSPGDRVCPAGGNWGPRETSSALLLPFIQRLCRSHTGLQASVEGLRGHPSTTHRCLCELTRKFWRRNRDGGWGSLLWAVRWQPHFPSGTRKMPGLCSPWA